MDIYLFISLVAFVLAFIGIYAVYKLFISNEH